MLECQRTKRIETQTLDAGTREDEHRLQQLRGRRTAATRAIWKTKIVGTQKRLFSEPRSDARALEKERERETDARALTLSLSGDGGKERESHSLGRNGAGKVARRLRRSERRKKPSTCRAQSPETSAPACCLRTKVSQKARTVQRDISRPKIRISVESASARAAPRGRARPRAAAATCDFLHLFFFQKKGRRELSLPLEREREREREREIWERDRPVTRKIRQEKSSLSLSLSL